MNMNKKYGFLLLGILLNCMPAVASKASMTVASPTLYDWIIRFDDFCKKGQLDSALVCADNMILLDGKTAYCYSLKASVLYNMGRYEEALEFNTKAYQIDPNETKIILDRCFILKHLSRYDESLTVLDDALKKFPENMTLHLMKASVYSYKKDSANVIAICKMILNNKEISYADRFKAHSLIVQHSIVSSLDDAIKNMEKDLGTSDYKMAAFIMLEYNTRTLYEKGDKYKKLAFKLHDQNKIDEETLLIDEYIHFDKIVQVYEYFNTEKRDGLFAQYEFRVYENPSHEWMYHIRVEFNVDAQNKGKSQMAVMKMYSRTESKMYKETRKELKSTSYEQWKDYTNQIIDNKLKGEPLR